MFNASVFPWKRQINNEKRFKRLIRIKKEKLLGSLT